MGKIVLEKGKAGRKTFRERFSEALACRDQLRCHRNRHVAIVGQRPYWELDMFKLLNAAELMALMLRKKVKAFRNSGICVVMLAEKTDEVVAYWESDGFAYHSNVLIDGVKMIEYPHLFVNVKAMFKRQNKLQVEGHNARIAVWQLDDPSKPLDKYVLMRHLLPGGVTQ